MAGRYKRLGAAVKRIWNRSLDRPDQPEYRYGEDKINPYLREHFLAYMTTEEEHCGKQEKEAVEYAHSNGFFYNSAVLYGLTPSNRKNYLSDYDYYRLFPLNGRYSFWINDKLTLMYTLREYKEYLPQYYYHIERAGRIYKLLDLTEQQTKAASTRDILELLKGKGDLVVKPVVGAVSSGLHILKYDQGQFYDNRVCIKEEDLAELLDSLEEYIVEEYIDYKPYLPENTDCIRLVVFNPNGYDPKVTCAYVIMDSIGAATEDVIYFPSYVVNINIQSGEFHQTRYINFYASRDSISKAPLINRRHEDTYPEHPYTGSVPHWEEIVRKTEEICRSIPQLSYLGLDVVLTQDSFRILEINSHQDPVCQIFTPYMEEGSVTEAFFRQALEELEQE